ncbi:hypothetical protein Patl1_11369 [Pistacia atlantica]|uniref:Uncharacterized protein n=1 Tax=Pistacia atlantica TaxID=434234 RepID=A0ACC1A357_9ROSI|nr:hypothetical protein Patl1_11369 [Pistacia atlantica]
MLKNIDAYWKECSGEKNWEGLLKPLNKDLNETIIHYGKRVQAIYDTIDNDKFSPTYGHPKFKEEEFFSKVGLGLYTVKTYLWTNAKDVDFAKRVGDVWIGYVAVATDEGKEKLGRRDIMVCWRGTLTLVEWINNLQVEQTSASPILGSCSGNARVHKGFLSIYTHKLAREKVLKVVSELLDQYKNEEISITVSGHSLGSALATLNAADIVANEYNKPPGSNTTAMVTTFAFASPKVGNSGFTTVFNKLKNLHLLHIKHIRDPVPGLPHGNNYSELGIVLTLNTTDPNSPLECHSLKYILKAIEATQVKSN